jgi:hypothetical protein
MTLDTERYKGWIVIAIRRATAWRIHNFLPLVDSLFKQIKDNHDQTGGRLLFDLSALSYFDSTMISLILRSVRLTGEQKNSLIIADDKTRDILALLGIDKLVDIYPSERDWCSAQGITFTGGKPA